jgi:hypothetical protein
MNTPSLTKYRFSIRTRLGLAVDNLTIHGRDEADAQRKLRQMYPHCEVLQCESHVVSIRATTASSFEDVIDLINQTPA